MALKIEQDHKVTVDITIAGMKTVISGSTADAYFRNAQGHADALQPLLKKARELLSEDDLVFDVGANIGISTLGLARLVPNGRVFAFEPSSRNATSLRSNLLRNGISNVTVVEAAVSSAGRPLHLTEPDGNGAASHVCLATDGRTNVVTIDLDSFVDRHALTRVALLKIDVEGHEPWVLAGGRSLIESQRPHIWMEYNAWCLMAFGRIQPVDFAIALFQAFSATSVEVEGLVPVSDPVAFVHENIIRHSCVTDLLLRLREHHRIPASFGVVQVDDSVREIVRLEAENADLRRRCAELEGDNTLLKSSTSWRITHPLRALKRLM